VFGEGVSFFSVVSCPGSLWYPKWWRRFGDLFDFLGYIPQRIIGGVCWSEALQESLYAVVFLIVQELSSRVAVVSSFLLSDVRNWCQALRSLRFLRLFALFG
jgi:hypothetical protein